MKRMLLVALLLAGLAGADEDKAKGPAKKAVPGPVVTRHEITLGGRKIAYTATAGYTEMKNENGEATAQLFSIAYQEANADPRQRPVTFVFNGGPGAASVWLHMGMLGPRRVAMSDKGEPLRPPAAAVDNAESWLDLTDLVFIDPVGTGYSRPAGKAKQADFSGLEEDTRSVGEFIRLWTTQNRRWGSPKFLCGESYGTTRAASLAGHLQDRYGMYLNGIVLVSSVLNFQTIRFGTGNDLPYVMYLPSYAATAWYHGRVEGELPDLVKKAEHFALDEYLPALAQGDRLPAAERKRIAATLAQLTGLSAEFIERSNLRVSQGRFCKELLRSEERTIGRLDARYKGIDRDAEGSHSEYDPSMAAISGPFSAAAKDYLRRELKYENDIQYRTLGGLGARWRFPEGRYVDVGDTLRRAMTENPHLRVLVASGYFDLATPFLATDYTVSHLGLDPTLAGHVRVRYYEAGHMMYVDKQSREQLKRDVAELYAWALADPPPAAKKE